jgi:hypothetical protein
MSGKEPGGKPRTLLCEQWEALLADALDGTLGATDSAAFYAHRDTCLACAQLLEESKRGTEWLHFLETEPEVPADLISKILAKTSGAEDTLPAMVPAGLPLVLPAAGWTGGWLPMMERHAAQSRWIMTAAMAFFSLAFTLNLTGVKLNSFRMADLKPTTLASGLTRQYYETHKSVMRYYDNLRFVYELESRVREMRRDTQPETPAADGSKGAGSNIDKNSTPGDQKPATRHTGGSARVPESDTEPVRQGEPVMAGFDHHQLSTHLPEEQFVWQKLVSTKVCGNKEHREAKNSDAVSQGQTALDTRNGGRKNVDDKRSEGSLA